MEINKRELRKKITALKNRCKYLQEGVLSLLVREDRLVEKGTSAAERVASVREKLTLLARRSVRRTYCSGG